MAARISNLYTIFKKLKSDLIEKNDNTTQQDEELDGKELNRFHSVYLRVIGL